MLSIAIACDYQNTGELIARDTEVSLPLLFVSSSFFFSTIFKSYQAAFKISLGAVVFASLFIKASL